MRVLAVLVSHLCVKISNVHALPYVPVHWAMTSSTNRARNFWVTSTPIDHPRTSTYSWARSIEMVTTSGHHGAGTVLRPSPGSRTSPGFLGRTTTVTQGLVALPRVVVDLVFDFAGFVGFFVMSISRLDGLSEAAWPRVWTGMQLHKDSHVDHGLTPAQLAFVVAHFADQGAFFIATVELPAELGTVPCGLYGPLMGDEPVTEDRVTHEARGGRAWTSRLLDAPSRGTRQVTVIAGPHDGAACVLYTAYGGPLAPQEPGDPGCKDVAASAAFWAAHALAR